MLAEDTEFLPFQRGSQNPERSVKVAEKGKPSPFLRSLAPNQRPRNHSETLLAHISPTAGCAAPLLPGLEGGHFSASQHTTACPPQKGPFYPNCILGCHFNTSGDSKATRPENFISVLCRRGKACVFAHKQQSQTRVKVVMKKLIYKCPLTGKPSVPLLFPSP